MAQARRGRPPTPLNPDASHAAKLGAEIRDRRTDAELTLEQLAERVGCSQQHISEIERAKTTPSPVIVAAVDRALQADGALERLLPPVLQDREQRRQDRADARRTAAQSSLPCDATLSEVAGDDEDVQPTNRRGLIGAAGAGALGLSVVATAPAAASEVDPGLPVHWLRLLAQLGRVDSVFGPREVLATVEHEIRVIAAYRTAAGGKLRVELMQVEARWAEFAAWLSNDAGQPASRRAAWADRAARLAVEAGCPDIHALACMRRSQWAGQDQDVGRAITHAQEALTVQRVGSQTRMLCELRAATVLALVGDGTACERHVAAAYDLLDADASTPAGWGWGHRQTEVLIRATEAHCWLALDPRKAIPLYESVLQDWPRECVRSAGLHRARLALSCAAAGERDRAIAEGRKARAIVHSTQSAMAAGELRRLGAVLRSA